MVVLVTGANGQLGQSLQFIAPNYPEIQFVFCTSSELDITDLNNIELIFNKFKQLNSLFVYNLFFSYLFKFLNIYFFNNS